MRYTSIDISPTSGRIKSGYLSYGRVIFDSEYSFKNSQKISNGSKVWDLDQILLMILEGLKNVGPSDFIGVSSWSYDFVLLDAGGKIIGDAVSFQDERYDSAENPISSEKLYERTGCEDIKYSTLNQLLAIKEESPELLDRAERLLFIPDYIVYRLTGKLCNEHTIASTSCLMDLETGNWNFALIDELGFPASIFQNISKPGDNIGEVLPEIAKEIGYSPKLMLIPSDRIPLSLDAARLDNDALLIYAGGLSTIGVITETPIITEYAREKGFSNIRLSDGRYLFSKRIAAGRIIRNFRSEFESGITYDEIENAARSTFVDKTFEIDDRFYYEAPVSKLIESEIGPIEKMEEKASIIYHSIVKAYVEAYKDISNILGRSFDEISISGGIVRDRYLNSLLSLLTDKVVLSGEEAASSLASILFMAFHSGELEAENRDNVLRKSLFLTTYKRLYD